MYDCKYCTNYHLNSHERVDDSCMGKTDCRSDFFSCNEDLRPKKESSKKATKIKVGTRVQFKTETGNILNLIAIKHESSGLFDTWLCVDPCGNSKSGECTLYNCFTDELKLGWTSRVRSENKVLDELVSKMNKEYLHRVGTQFDNAIVEMEKLAERLKN